MASFFGSFDIWQVLSSFIFLFAIVDPLGNIPVTLNMERKGVKISPAKVSIATIVILSLSSLLENGYSNYLV
jgi:multiple antibiotic resistance protein